MLRGIRKASANWLGRAVMAVVLGGLVLGYIYFSWQSQLTQENNRIKQLQNVRSKWRRFRRKKRFLSG